MPTHDSKSTNQAITRRQARLGIISVALTALFCGLLFFVFQSPSPPNKGEFSNDWTGLFVAVTKGFGGDTYFLGSDAEWAYFRSGRLGPVYRKVDVSRIRVPTVFEFDEGEPYRINLRNFVGYENP